MDVKTIGHVTCFMNFTTDALAMDLLEGDAVGISFTVKGQKRPLIYASQTGVFSSDLSGDIVNFERFTDFSEVVGSRKLFDFVVCVYIQKERPVAISLFYKGVRVATLVEQQYDRFFAFAH